MVLMITLLSLKPARPRPAADEGFINITLILFMSF